MVEENIINIYIYGTIFSALFNTLFEFSKLMYLDKIREDFFKACWKVIGLSLLSYLGLIWGFGYLLYLNIKDTKEDEEF